MLLTKFRFLGKHKPTFFLTWCFLCLTFLNWNCVKKAIKATMSKICVSFIAVFEHQLATTHISRKKNWSQNRSMFCFLSLYMTTYYIRNFRIWPKVTLSHISQTLRSFPPFFNIAQKQELLYCLKFIYLLIF